MSSIPLGQAARPEAIASVAAFLASDGASWVTGVALRFDGGFLAK
jgi:NAD(P)-dependent dehydrogenase (short-subunit alcohol dehydrogenase family)